MSVRGVGLGATGTGTGAGALVARQNSQGRGDNGHGHGQGQGQGQGQGGEEKVDAHTHTPTTAASHGDGQGQGHGHGQGHGDGHGEGHGHGHRKTKQNDTLVDIFLFGRPWLFFRGVEILELYMSFYIAVASTQIIPLVIRTGGVSGTGGGFIFGFVVPIVLNLFAMQQILVKAVLLRAVYELVRERCEMNS